MLTKSLTLPKHKNSNASSSTRRSSNMDDFQDLEFGIYRAYINQIGTQVYQKELELMMKAETL